MAARVERASSTFGELSSVASNWPCRIMFSVESHCYTRSLCRSDLENAKAKTLSLDGLMPLRLYTNGRVHSASFFQWSDQDMQVYYQLSQHMHSEG